MTWRLAAIGKHPAVRDYFRAGDEFPLAGALADWAGKGYAAQDPKAAAAGGMRSWRFFARGGQRDAIACGVLRDSADALGRPYPLLVAASGPLPGWEAAWELLPLALEAVWGEIERVAAGGYPGLAPFEEALRAIGPKAPAAGFPACRSLLDEALAGQPGLPPFAPRPDEDRLLPVDDGPGTDVSLQAARWLLAARRLNPAAPGVAFLGGGFGGTGLIFFRRALVPGDFARLRG